MKVNIRKTNHIERKKGKRSKWLYIIKDKTGFKKVILTRDTEVIKSNFYFDINNDDKFSLGEGCYLEMINPKNWITDYNKHVRYDYKKSIQIDVSNEETQQLIIEDSSILYNVENVNLEEYDINLYLPPTTEVIGTEEVN